MEKQITYVIQNDNSELYSSMAHNHIYWTELITHATLFENQYLAEKTNKIVKGEVKKMKYTLKSLNFIKDCGTCKHNAVSKYVAPCYGCRDNGGYDHYKYFE